MSETRRLQEHFRVAERFRRSVNVALDYEDADSLDGYVVTPLSTSVLSRILAGLGPKSRNRSWSITGPYGGGKSACMLFMSQMLAYPARDCIRSMVRQSHPALHRHALEIPGWEQGGFIIMPMVCGRQQLSRTLLVGLLNALDSVQEPTGDLAEHVAYVRTLHKRTQQDDLAPSGEIAQAVEKTAQLLQAQHPPIVGMVLVLDELGKSLEYAALNPDRGDIELLQVLAEMASRSVTPVIGLLTVLHQAFEHYAASLSPVQQREWSKVQGRFEDIGFTESAGELLGLVSRAIEPVDEAASLSEMIMAEARQAEGLDILPRDLGTEDALQTIAACAPLHPTVALTLGPLFRSRLAQNERSLFAFLCSGEPQGFQDYLHVETWSDNGYRPFYRLDKLYDYVLAALGSGLYAQSQGKHWAEISEALERLPKDASSLDARSIKAIGMLGLLGDQRYLRASKDILSYALADGYTIAQDVEASLNRLTAWKISLYQGFKDAYGIWQGSDVDVDACFERGAGQVDRSVSLASLLQQGSYLKPYVAKRHLHETGSFRFFVPKVTDLESLGQAREEDHGSADGKVLFVLPPPGMRLQNVTNEVVHWSTELASPTEQQILYAIPRHTQGIREALEEVMVWDWVGENTPELEGDSVARREIAARHLSARTRLDRAISHCFGLSSSYNTCLWVWQGKVQNFSSARALASFLSNICDHIYGKAPIIRNELINRRSLSSAAAAARRALIERMLTQGAEENLGLEGYPPEMSIYLSVLRTSGLHRVAQQGWEFALPTDEGDSCRVRPMWQAMDDFTATTKAGHRPVTELFDLLRRPPFGIRDGLLPIYLAAYMIHGQGEIALYEEDTFVPQVSIAEFERLLRAPQRFALQRYRLSDARARLLDGYVRLFNPKPEPGQVTMLNAVRGLMRFANRLPRYTQLTEGLSDDARAIRRALTAAREPQPLLYEVLPAALGFSVVDDVRERTDAYLGRFRQALLELQQAYDGLLARIERELLDALRLPANLQAARQEIAQRAGMLGDWLADLSLRAFAQRLSDSQLSDRQWLESVAAVVVSKPPANWGDADLRKYSVTLTQLAEQLRRVEEVALSRGERAGTGRILRIGITDEAGQERRDVLHITPDKEREIEKAADALSRTLEQLGLDNHTGLTALAELTRRWLEGQSRKDQDAR